MFSDDLKIHIPTDEEEAAIQREIAMDPDAPEWTDENWARARPAIEVDPELVLWARQIRAQREKDKERVSVQLDADLAEHFRASGPGWQTRLNDTLRKAVFGA